MRKLIIGLKLMLSGMPHSYAPATPLTLDVWPGNAPGETTSSPGTSEEDSEGSYGKITKVTDVTGPQLFWYAAPGPIRPRPTVVICPGGGYWILATDIEGSEIAAWINSLGYNAAVLHYRVPNRRDGALQDAQRALSLLRSKSETLGIDIHHLGILGFSAGGHLVARLSCCESRSYDTVDEADKFSSRPDFSLLIYPAYLWDKAGGQAPPEVQPHAGMPPVFLTQTRDDSHFEIENYVGALEAAGVPAHAAMYDSGGHGYGLRLDKSLQAHHWSDEAAAWLKLQTTK